jgi:hypothetical protein
VVDEATELMAAIRLKLPSVSEEVNSSTIELSASGNDKLSGAAAIEPVSFALGLHTLAKHPQPRYTSNSGLRSNRLQLIIDEFLITKHTAAQVGLAASVVNLFVACRRSLRYRHLGQIEMVVALRRLQPESACGHERRRQRVLFRTAGEVRGAVAIRRNGSSTDGRKPHRIWAHPRKNAASFEPFNAVLAAGDPICEDRAQPAFRS